MNLLLAMTLGASTAAALPPPPPPISVTAAEQALLDDREVVVRYQGPRKETVAIMDMRAAPGVVMGEVMNLEPRQRELSGIKSLQIYEQSAGHLGARWEVGIAMFGAVFHIQYDYDAAAGWCVYALDESKDNTIESSKGSYQVYAQGDGSRMVYRSVSVGSESTPEWLSKKLATGSAKDMLSGIRARAEAR
jgi:hypothetical protein